METVTIPQVRKSGGLIGAELSGLDLDRILLNGSAPVPAA